MVDRNEWRPWEMEGITELQYYHRLHLESSKIIEDLGEALQKMERDRDGWAEMTRDYKRDLGEFVRRGPEGMVFEVIPKDRWKRIVEFLELSSRRGRILSDLAMVLRAGDLLAEIEAEDG